MNRAALAALLALAPLAAAAAPVCRLATSGGLAFGSYDLLAAAPRDSQMGVTIRCEGNGSAGSVTLVVRLDQGMHGSSVHARRMRHSGGMPETLAYGLYRDPARSSNWGTSDGVDTVAASLAVPATGAATASFVVYGRIPPRQDARVGDYADAVQLTISY